MIKNKQRGVAQLVEQLICNQQVGGSSPSTSFKKIIMGEFPSGQRGQTVNLLRFASMVRIRPLPPERLHQIDATFFYALFIRVSEQKHPQNLRVDFTDENSLFRPFQWM